MAHDCGVDLKSGEPGGLASLGGLDKIEHAGIIEKTPDGFGLGPVPAAYAFPPRNIGSGHGHTSYVRGNTWSSGTVSQGRYTGDPSLSASAVGCMSRVAAAIEG